MLQPTDRLWVEPLPAMDEMRQGIGLQAYGQTDPLVAYKREAHDMWGQLLENIRHAISHSIYHVGLAATPSAPPPIAPAGENGAGQPNRRLRENRPDQAAVPPASKVGRNAPCPCGSGRKYKKCHGVAA